MNKINNSLPIGTCTLVRGFSQEEIDNMSEEELAKAKHGEYNLYGDIYPINYDKESKLCQ